MKWYFASRTRHREFVESLIHTLKINGHEVVFDWTLLKLRLPFQNYPENSQFADALSLAIPLADVFVLLSDPAGTDMFIELGIALANFIDHKKPRIYIVGKHNKRSLMHLHSGIIHVDTLQEVFKKECPEVVFQQ